MLDKIFHVVNGVTQLDEKSLMEITDEQFLKLVALQIGEVPISKMRLTGTRNDAFMFFRAQDIDYSFAYDRKQLLFQRLERGNWHFIVGWMHV
ncbi:hypothetical protein [Paenibacillus sp. JCM 10914]|uniref:hypothetical protein n=1 Tax=Paenibacillus sp. JCM 10914 TaxID=1236974 RepID=UPI0003CC3FEC|nr:hypothetical protein [Paenibacillus sp. JCM 10914]GAE10034.1 hypothetical protein JCM10914_6434 [Paenibacillus sp. JCM 10914]